MHRVCIMHGVLGVCVWSSGKQYIHRQVCQVVTNVMEESKAGKDGVGGSWWAVFLGNRLHQGLREGGAVSWDRRSRWREQPVWIPERGSAGWV